jgi:hypothetical protein
VTLTDDTVQTEVGSDVDYPQAPRSISDLRLGDNFLISLLIKHMYISDLESPEEIRNKMKLPNNLITALLRECLSRKLIESLGGGQAESAERRYTLSVQGRAWAIDALEKSLYVGPTPVRLTDYIAQLRKQQLANENIDSDHLKRCLSSLVLPDDIFGQVGAGITFGRSMLFYGSPGNGKTSVAKALGNAFQQNVYIPYAIEVDGQVINVFDSSVHKPVDPRTAGASEAPAARKARAGGVDGRWVLCRRPVALAGGELNLDMLELSFNPYSKVYEAPLQFKANGGIFIIDDFGRQLVAPEQILNRWVIPLETRVDYLTLQTGKKFAIPFDELVVISTNLDPNNLLDAAMKRRINYKINFHTPSEEDYVQIFEGVCRSYKIELPSELLSFVMNDFYRIQEIPFACFHPKWVVEQCIAKCKFEHRAPKLDRDLVMSALRNLDTEYH